MPRRKAPLVAAPAPARSPRRPRLPALPDTRAIQKDVERQVRQVFSALASPTTLLAGAQALSALRNIVEVAARHGPSDPRVRASAVEVERAVLTAVREAAGTLLQELSVPRGAVEKVPEDQPLVVVSVERERATPGEETAPAPERPSPPRTRRRASRSGAPRRRR